MVVAWAGGGGNEEFMFNGDRIHFGKMEKVLEMGGADGGTTV